MAGYKRTVMDLEPVWFITFDGDSFSGGSNIIGSGRIIDEMGNTEGIIHDEDNNFKGYYAGMASHIESEQSNQWAMRFGANMRNPLSVANGTSLAPCSYFEFENRTEHFWDETNEFTLVFTMKKDNHPYDDWVWTGEVNNSLTISSLSETIMRLGNIFQFRTQYNRYTNDNWYIDLLLDENDSSIYTIRGLGSSFDGLVDSNSPRASFCIIRYKDGVFEWIIDGHVKAKVDVSTKSNYDPTKHTLKAMNNSIISGLKFKEMTFFLGGIPTNEIRVTTPKKQIVSKCEFDQMSLFNKYLDDKEITRLYRRVWHKETMYSIENPQYYIPFDDKKIDIVGQNSVKVVGSGASGTILDDYRNVITEIEGHYINEKGMFFPSRGYMLPHVYPHHYTSVSLNESFTLEFSYKGYTSKRFALFQIIDSEGVDFTIFGNSNDGVFRIGWIDVRYDGKIKSFKCDIFDNEWHRIIIRKFDGYFDIFINQTQYIYREPIYSKQRFHIYSMLLNSHDKDTNSPGAICNLVKYNHPLNDIILNAHANFNSLYRVKGQIVKSGQPYSTTVRVYSHVTGRLLAETKSDSITGNFNVDLASSELVDLVALNADGDTARLRAVGQIDPDVINDSVLTIP